MGATPGIPGPMRRCGGPWLVLPLLLLLLLLRGAGAAEEAEPAPVPTNAAEAQARALTSRGSALLPRSGDRDAAREAAWLQALHRLGQEALGTPGEVRIDAGAPRYDVLGWLLGATSTEEPGPADAVVVRLDSLPRADLEAGPAPAVVTLEADVDGDGRPEQVCAGRDTRLWIRQGDRVLGSSPGLGALEGRTGPEGFERILLTRLVSVDSVEPAGPGRVRVVARLATREAVGGRLAGGAEERREVLVSLAPAGEAPSIEITEPAAEAREPRSRVELRGRVTAPAGLQEVLLRLNGTDLWKSPQGLRTRALQLDLVLDLRPGPNEALLTVTDKLGRRLERRLALVGAAAGPSGQARALVVGVDAVGGADLPGLRFAERDAAAVRDALAARSFQVRTLLGAEATRQALLEALDGLATESRPGDRVLLYFAGPSSLGVAAEGKLLLPVDGTAEGNALSGGDLGRWARRLPASRVLVVLDTAAVAPADSVDAWWLENTDFLRSLAGPGRLLVATGDPNPEAREDEEMGGGLLTAALLKAWKTSGDPFAAASQAYPAAVRAALARAEQLGEPELLPLLRGE